MSTSSTYTTGELAKACNTTVRTVQYYDARGILTPSALSEGGRRLYSESDLSRMKAICFLRELGLPIKSIGEILQAKEAGTVLRLLLEQQAESLRSEVNQKQEKLAETEALLRALKDRENLTVESVYDMARTMENKKKLSAVHRRMILMGILMDIIEIGTLLIWIFRGIWWPFVVGMLIVIALGIIIVRYWFQHTDFICPECGKTFRPSRREAFFARHTPKTRKLTCTCCGTKSWCVETYMEPEQP